MTENLQKNDPNAEFRDLDSADPVKRAVCREKAQDIIASPEINLEERAAVTDRLLEANQTLTFKNVTKDESY